MKNIDDLKFSLRRNVELWAKEEKVELSKINLSISIGVEVAASSQVIAPGRRKRVVPTDTLPTANDWKIILSAGWSKQIFELLKKINARGDFMLTEDDTKNQWKYTSNPSQTINQKFRNLNMPYRFTCSVVPRSSEIMGPFKLVRVRPKKQIV